MVCLPPTPSILKAPEEKTFLLGVRGQAGSETGLLLLAGFSRLTESHCKTLGKSVKSPLGP